MTKSNEHDEVGEKVGASRPERRQSIWVTASGAGTDGEETEALLELAGELGMSTGTPPMDLSPAGRILVLIDLVSIDASPRSRPIARDWIKRGGEALVMCGSSEAPKTEGPVYHGCLHPREQLRTLAFRDRAGELARLYAEERDCGTDNWLYANDRSDKPAGFDVWLNAQADAYQGATNERRPEGAALWRQAIELLLRPGGLRELAELLIVPSCGGLPTPLVIEAAVCVSHCRHAWWERGAALPERALLLVESEKSQTESKATNTAERASDTALAWLEHVRIYGNEELFERPRLKPMSLDSRVKPDKNVTSSKWSGAYTKFFAAVKGKSSKSEDDLRARNAQLSDFLGRLLLAGRPLRHAGCTLLLPFDPGPELVEVFRKAVDDKARAGETAHADSEGETRKNELGVRRAVYGPVRLHLDQDERHNEDQAQLFFLPELRELLYEQRADACPLALSEWRLSPEHLRGWRLSVQPDVASDPVVAEVRRVHLYRYYDNTYVLAIGLEAPTLPEAAWALDSEDNDWWHPLACADADVFALLRQRQLETWFGYARLARVIYPSFVEQGEERKIAKLRLDTNGGREVIFAAMRQPGGDLLLEQPPRLSPILTAFLGEFVPETEQDLRSRVETWGSLYDDRLFGQLVYALAGPKLPSTEPGQGAGKKTGANEPTQDDAERVFSLALFADRFADIAEGCNGYAYDPRWVCDAVKEASLRLWDAAGVRIGCTEATNVYLGSGDYFSNIVARRHVPYAYQRMLLQALFYQAALRRFNKEIGTATKALATAATASSGRRDFTELRRKFIQFTNLCWFRELTAQMQGKALFRLQQKALGLEDEYKLIKDEMERADEYLEARRSERFNRAGILAGIVGLVFAGAAAWIAVMPMVPLDGEVGSLTLSVLSLRVWLRWFWLFAAGLMPPLLLAIGLYALGRHCRRKRKWYCKPLLWVRAKWELWWNAPPEP